MGFLLGRGAVTVINKIKMGNSAPVSHPATDHWNIYLRFLFPEGNGYLAVYIAGL